MVSKSSLPLAVLAARSLTTSRLPNVARAEEPTTSAVDAGSLYKQLDANGDGSLAGDEIPEDKRSLFERLVRIGDGNADGNLSRRICRGTFGRKEIRRRPRVAQKGHGQPRTPRQGGASGPGRLFARLDSNQDGEVTSTKFPNRAARISQN